MRFLNAVLFALAAGYVGWHNSSHQDSYYVFPALGGLVGPDPAAQGRVTVGILASAAALFLLRDLWWLRTRDREG